MSGATSFAVKKIEPTQDNSRNHSKCYGFTIEFLVISRPHFQVFFVCVCVSDVVLQFASHLPSITLPIAFLLVARHYLEILMRAFVPILGILLI